MLISSSDTDSFALILSPSWFLVDNGYEVKNVKRSWWLLIALIVNKKVMSDETRHKMDDRHRQHTSKYNSQFDFKTLIAFLA